MSKQETIMILAMLGAFYSGGKNDPKTQSDAWYSILYKYDFETARMAVLHFAENDTRDYATFPAVGKIVQAIKEQEKQDKAPVVEIIKSIQYGTPYESLSERARMLIGEGLYDEWLDLDAEEFAGSAEYYRGELEMYRRNGQRMISG